MKKITYIIISSLLLSTIAEANPLYLLPIGVISTVTSAVIESQATIFQNDLIKKIKQGDTVAYAQLTAFRNHLPKKMPMNAIETAVHITATGMGAAPRGNASLYLIGTPVCLMNRINGVVGAAAIGFTIYDYILLNKAINAANAITAESMQADKRQKALDIANTETMAFLHQHRPEIERLAKALQAKDKLTDEEIIKLINQKD